MSRPDTDQYRAIFLSDAPMVDLRAPCEFAEGSFPQAINLPLMNDEERRKVGTCYKQHGQEAAIALGHRLVSGDTRARRLAGWKQFAEAHPDDGYIFCFRGGLRSRTVQQWLREAGVDYPLVLGGYKAMRRFLIDTIDRLATHYPLVVLGGLTGCNKTGLVMNYPYGVDLEGLANHRGSSFGGFPGGQPTPIHFENALAIALLKGEAAGFPFILLEDEGRIIGSLSVPLSLHRAMGAAPLVLLTASFEARVENILEDYVTRMVPLFTTFDDFRDYLLDAVDRIRKRLGGERHATARKLVLDALAAQARSGDVAGHRAWIAFLLDAYYDPMYRYQVGKKQERVVFEGDRDAVIEFLNAGNVRFQSAQPHQYSERS